MRTAARADSTLPLGQLAHRSGGGSDFRFRESDLWRCFNEVWVPYSVAELSDDESIAITEVDGSVP